MKTLGDMIDNIRWKIGDTSDMMAEDPHIQEAINNGVERVSNDLAFDNRAKMVLRKYGDPTSFVAGQEIYEVPENCIRVLDIQMRRSADQRWMQITRREPERDFAATSGSTEIFGSSKSLTHGAIAWSDDVDEGYVRLWPAFNTVSGEEFRFCYVRRLPYLEKYDATFNDPDADGTIENRYPVRITDAVEWASILNLATDQGAGSINYKSANYAYSQVLQGISGVGRSTEPRRRYIPRVNGR